MEISLEISAPAGEKIREDPLSLIPGGAWRVSGARCSREMLLRGRDGAANWVQSQGLSSELKVAQGGQISSRAPPQLSVPRRG